MVGCAIRPRCFYQNSCLAKLNKIKLKTTIDLNRLRSSEKSSFQPRIIKISCMKLKEKIMYDCPVYYANSRYKFLGYMFLKPENLAKVKKSSLLQHPYNEY